MLTWKNRKILEYDRETLTLIETHELLPGIKEGWGITNLPTFDKLFISDGTDTIKIVDWEERKIIGSLKVTDDQGKSIDRINELEYRDGFIYANVWHDKRVLKIDADTGTVTD